MKNKRKSITMRVLYLPCILIMLLLFMPMGAYAESREDIASGQRNDISWRIDADGHLTVSGTGDWGWGSPPWREYSKLIKAATINVTELTDVVHMFADCNNLTSLDLSGLDTSNVTRMDSMFIDCSSLTSLDLSGFDTSNVTRMDQMFAGCNNLTSLNLSGFDTSNVISMDTLFFRCSSLTSLDLSSFDTSNVTSMMWMFLGCSNLTSLDLSGFDTSNVTHMEMMFSDCSSLASLDLNGFDTSNVTRMDGMFTGSNNLKSLDLSSFDTSNVTSMDEMFANCSNLTSLDLSGFDTSDIISMREMFRGCSSLTSLDLSGFSIPNMHNNMFQGCSSLTSLNLNGIDTSNMTSMAGMFSGCSSLKSLDLSSFDTSNVTSMDSMFAGCSNLTSLDLSGFDTSNIISMRWMFQGCSSLTSLDLSGFSIPNMTRMDDMFQGCSSLTSLNLNGIDTSNMTHMVGMFRGCSSLTSLDLSSFDTSNVTSMDEMFAGCSSLKSLDLSGFDTSNIISMKRMFRGCSSLTSLDLSNFDTSNVKSMESMFVGCCDLESLDLSSFDTSNVTRMDMMLSDCSSLTSLDLSNFDMSNVSMSSDDISGIFSSCSSLTLFHTPKNVAHEWVYLPKTFYKADGTSIKKLPNSPGSILLASDPAYFTNGIASGTSNNISWAIDVNGQLTVTGTGDWAHSMNDMAPWGSYTNSIKSAVVNLIGTTDISKMFYGCSVLVSVDFSNFDMSSVTAADNVFALCSRLAEIKTPTKIAANLNVSLPASYKESGQTTMYASLSSKNKGILLVKAASVNKLTGADREMYHRVVSFQGKDLDIVWDDRLFEKNAFTYNNNLAVAGLVLSAAAEGSQENITDILTNMGFEGIHSEYYDSAWNLFHPAYTFAYKKIRVGGQIKTLVSVTIRGTSSLGDGITDLTNGGLGGHAEDISRKLEQYVETNCGQTKTEDTLFFVTGHSLGGGIASRLDHELCTTYSSGNLYVYSFAPLNYIPKFKTEYKNVFEICNIYDTVTWCGCAGSTHAGVIRQFAGSSEKYLPYYRLLKGEDSKLPPADYKAWQIFEHHDVSLYMAYLISGARKIETLYSPSDNYFRIAIKCPVDVEIYDAQENLLCRVSGNICDDSVQTEKVFCYVKEDEKYFLAASDTEIAIRLTGTAVGNMEYSITKLKGLNGTIMEDDIKAFQNVTLAEGKEFYSKISSADSISAVPLFVVDSSTGEKTKEVSVTGDESAVSSEGETPEKPDASTNSGENSNLPSKENDLSGNIKIDKISIVAPSKRLAAGKKVGLAVRISPANATNKKISWNSSNKKYATVDKNGRLSLKKAGVGRTVTITAKAQNGKKASLKIKIMKHAVKKIQIKVLAKNGKILKAGKSVSLSAKVTTTGKKANKSLSWSSSNSKHASVNKKGKVKAKKAGKGKSVTITVSATDGSRKKAKIKFEIK